MAQPAHIATRTAGRPVKTQIHPHVEARICEALRLGMPYKLAAHYGGVTYQTLLNWKRRAEEGESGFLSFVVAMNKAEAEGAIKLLMLIRAAAENPRHWRAAAWILERRWPEHYGRHRTTSKPAATVDTIQIVRMGWTSEDAELLLVEAVNREGVS